MYCNSIGNSTLFVEFMLETIKLALDEALTTCSAEQVEEQVSVQDLLEYCETPRSRAEMQGFCRVSGRKKYNTDYLKPLLESGQIAMTVPEKPNSRNQKYYTVK